MNAPDAPVDVRALVDIGVYALLVGGTLLDRQVGALLQCVGEILLEAGRSEHPLRLRSL